MIFIMDMDDPSFENSQNKFLLLYDFPLYKMQLC